MKSNLVVVIFLPSLPHQLDHYRNVYKKFVLSKKDLIFFSETYVFDLANIKPMSGHIEKTENRYLIYPFNVPLSTFLAFS